MQIPGHNEKNYHHIVTHNVAIVNSNENPNSSFEKLKSLVEMESCPVEAAFNNLLLLYIKYDYITQAHDLMSQGLSLGRKIPKVGSL